MAYVLGIILLIVAYFTYGKFLEKVFGVNPDRKTPAYTKTDGIDYVPMATWRVFLIQLLNIAGLGPIYGALQGALWGPSAYLWIVLGCIFAGAVHDFISGMISLRHDGGTIAEIHGAYLGKTLQQVMRVFTIVMLILVGVVFVAGPALLLSMLTKGSFFTYGIWVAIVFIYYFLATVLPIDVLIGKLYPIFGACLIIMAIGVGGGLLWGGYKLPVLTLENLNPAKVPIWPALFITVACGAISGFHATQSPLMARCIKNEKQGRTVFYGAMIAEAIIAMIWATVGMAFFKGGLPELAAQLKAAGPNGVVYNACMTMMGSIGGALAIIGVVVCPITSGDTAFRGARLIVADIFHIDQKPALKRFLIAIPMFVIGVILSQVNFDILWRYFAWANQTLAMVTLWACSVFLYKYKGNYHWITTIPAMFMTAVTSSYIYTQKIGFNIPVTIGNALGVITMAVLLGCFLIFGTKYAKKIPDINKDDNAVA
jgi:Carbon starvation protein, predicted membrane protein